MSATLIKCDGDWGLDASVTGDPHVTCDGDLVVVENPPLSALDEAAVADLTGAAVLAFAVAFGVKLIRRVMGY